MIDLAVVFYQIKAFLWGLPPCVGFVVIVVLPPALILLTARVLTPTRRRDTNLE